MLGYQEDGSFATDNSGRETLHKCQLKWWLGVYFGRTTKAVSKDLFCGVCLHLAMEEFYKGVDPEKVLRRFDQRYGSWARGEVDPTDNKSHVNIRSVLWTCVLERRIVNPPYQPVTGWVEFAIDYLLAPGVRYTGKIDAIVESDSGYAIEDTKSTGRPDKGFAAQFEINDATTGYYDGVRELGFDVPMSYINIIHAKALPANMESACSTHSKGKPRGAPKTLWADCWSSHNESRVIGPFLRDPAEIEPFRKRVVADVEVMKELVDRAPQLIDIEKIPATGKLSPRTACEWCEFRPFCLTGITHEKVMAHTVEHFWDPRDVVKSEVPE